VLWYSQPEYSDAAKVEKTLAENDQKFLAELKKR